MRVSDITFHDPVGQSDDSEPPMDFPFALMKTAQAVVQDGHTLFRFGFSAAILRSPNECCALAARCCSDNGLTRPASDQVLPLGLLVRHVGDQAFTTSSEISLQHRFCLGAIPSYNFLLTFRFRCSSSGGCVFEREISKGNDDRLFYFTASNATFSYEISPESAGLSVIMFANCYSNYVGVSYTVSLDIENPGGVRVSAGTCRCFPPHRNRCDATVSARSSRRDAGDAALPSVFLVFACFMAAAAVRWAREMSRNAAHVVGIHRVMAALVVVKSLWLAVASFHWCVPTPLAQHYYTPRMFRSPPDASSSCA
jgi:hypothetical protein